MHFYNILVTGAVDANSRLCAGKQTIHVPRGNIDFFLIYNN